MPSFSKPFTSSTIPFDKRCLSRSVIRFRRVSLSTSMPMLYDVSVGKGRSSNIWRNT